MGSRTAGAGRVQRRVCGARLSIIDGGQWPQKSPDAREATCELHNCKRHSRDTHLSPHAQAKLTLCVLIPKCGLIAAYAKDTRLNDLVMNMMSPRSKGGCTRKASDAPPLEHLSRVRGGVDSVLYQKAGETGPQSRRRDVEGSPRALMVQCELYSNSSETAVRARGRPGKTGGVAKLVK